VNSSNDKAMTMPLKKLDVISTMENVIEQTLNDVKNLNLDKNKSNKSSKKSSNKKSASDNDNEEQITSKPSVEPMNHSNESVNHENDMKTDHEGMNDEKKPKNGNKRSSRNNKAKTTANTSSSATQSDINSSANAPNNVDGKKISETRNNEKDSVLTASIPTDDVNKNPKPDGFSSNTKDEKSIKKRNRNKSKGTNGTNEKTNTVTDGNGISNPLETKPSNPPEPIKPENTASITKSDTKPNLTIETNEKNNNKSTAKTNSNPPNQMNSSQPIKTSSRNKTRKRSVNSEEVENSDANPAMKSNSDTAESIKELLLSKQRQGMTHNPPPVPIPEKCTTPTGPPKHPISPHNSLVT
jgi:hypothetical protein